MNIVIVAPCTGHKNWKGPYLDFDTIQKARVSGTPLNVVGLPRIPAAHLYAGLSHKRMMQGIEAYRHAHVGRVELYIVSAGMGVIEETEPVFPYEATFTTLRGQKRIQWAQDLGIVQNISNIMTKSADLRIVLLGREYLEVTQLRSLSCPVPTVVLAAPSAGDLIPHGALHVPLGQKQAAHFHHTLVALKGELVRRVLIAIAQREKNGENVRTLPAWRDADAFLHLCEEIA